MVELESDGEVAAFLRQFANEIDDGDLNRRRDGDGGRRDAIGRD